MTAGSIVPSALTRTWYETGSLTPDAVHCGGNFGLLRGRQGSILTCPEVPDSQKGGPREYPYRFAAAVHIHVIRGGWVEPREADGSDRRAQAAQRRGRLYLRGARRGLRRAARAHGSS